jgi:tetratricopeptide (TPR) repeat protein
LLALVFAAVAVAAYAWWSATPPILKSPSLPDLANLDEDVETGGPQNPGYLGPQACVPCHRARVAEFLRTPHARACRTPSDGPMPPGFEPGKSTYITGTPGLRFNMTRENGGYFLTARQNGANPEEQTRSRIDLLYGANKADEVFFSWKGDRLYEQMVVWLHPSNQWANTPYDPHGSGGFAREATTRCLECHNTWFEHVRGTVNEYKPESFILGVSCERCHGPGKEHVEFHRSQPMADAAHAIIHPGRLSRERQIEVCTQCHGNLTRARGVALSYRPGKPLEDYYRTAAAKHPEEDHVANQVKYLRQSKCFQNSDSLTCTTCHDPHRPHDPADAGAARKACLQCHKPDSCSDHPNLPAEVRDDCISCHMPQRVWMNVHFHTATDRYVPPIRRYQHQIGKYPEARSEVLLAWHRAQSSEASRKEADRLTRELAAHWFGEAERRHRDYRFLAAIGAAREALRLELPPDLREKSFAKLQEEISIQTRIDADFVAAIQAASEQRNEEAIGTLNLILRTKPDLAVAHSKLGTLYTLSGRVDVAAEHLMAVARNDPDNASGYAMLGWLAILGNRPKEAAEYYRLAEQIEPFDAKINYHWALALSRLGEWGEAGARYRRVLAIDPNHAGGCLGLSEALRRQGKPEEAVRYAWRAARLTAFEQADMLVNLADAYIDAGRAPEAAAAATKAVELDASAVGESRLDFASRRRMQDIISRFQQ